MFKRLTYIQHLLYIFCADIFETIKANIGITIGIIRHQKMICCKKVVLHLSRIEHLNREYVPKSHQAAVSFGFSDVP